MPVRTKLTCFCLLNFTCLILGGTTAGAAPDEGSTDKCDLKLRVPRVKLLDLPTVTAPRERIQAFRTLHQRLGPIFSYGARQRTVHVTGGELIDGLRATPGALARSKDRADLPAPPGVPPRTAGDERARARLAPVLDLARLRRRHASIVSAATARAAERLTHQRDLVTEPAPLADALAGSAVHALLFEFDLRDDLRAELHRVAGNLGDDGPGPADFRRRFEGHVMSLLPRLTVSTLGAELFDVADGFPAGWWQEQVISIALAAWDQTREVLVAALVEIARHPELRERFARDAPEYPRERFLRDLLATTEVTERIVSQTIRVKGFLVRADSVVSIDPGPEGRDHLIDDVVIFASEATLTELLAKYDVTRAATTGDGRADEPRLALKPR